jgi:N-acetylglutamate synthase-like GNAT family acetyltransferase
VELENINFSKARMQDIKDIHSVLLKAFESYNNDYTNDAYIATVLSTTEIKNRILGEKYEIYVITINKKIIGTVSISKKNKYKLYIRSMAVHPNYQKRGIGHFILNKIIELAKKNNIEYIFLDTSKLLKEAVEFYKKFGFVFTGVKHDFYGIEIYEMIKKL